MSLCSAWQGLKNMATVNTAPSIHRTIQVAGSNPASLPNNLNSIFSRFETDNTTQLEAIISSLKPAAVEISYNREETVRAFRRNKEDTTPGPDNIRGCVPALLCRAAEGPFPALYGQLYSSLAVEALYSGPHPHEELSQSSESPEAGGSHLSCDVGYGESNNMSLRHAN